MSDRYKHISDCLEVARNARYCAGAEKAATEIEHLQARNELLEKVVEAAELAAPKGIYGYDMDALDKLRKALAALKEQDGENLQPS